MGLTRSVSSDNLDPTSPDRDTSRLRVPDGLAWLAQSQNGAAWLDDLPSLVAEIADSWDLEIGDPFAGSQVSWVAPARRARQDVVVKVQWPDPESEHEAAALEAWAGDGAVQLLAHDAQRHALLLERCRPGTHLADAAESDAVAVFVDLLPRLWKEARAPFRSLTDESARWASTLAIRWEAAGRPCERRLVAAATSFLQELSVTQGEQVLVHQDLHGDNVLAAERRPWLVIDPKPIVGEREFAVAPVVRSFEFGHSPSEVVGRLDRLCRELHLDRERARGWTIAQTMAWSFDSSFSARHYDTVRWLLDT